MHSIPLHKRWMMLKYVSVRKSIRMCKCHVNQIRNQAHGPGEYQREFFLLPCSTLLFRFEKSTHCKLRNINRATSLRLLFSLRRWNKNTLNNFNSETDVTSRSSSGPV